VCGANGYMWRITHNVVHHTYTNIHGIDEDLEVSPLLRLSPRGRVSLVHRFQPLYAFLLYSFSTLFWVSSRTTSTSCSATSAHTRITAVDVGGGDVGAGKASYYTGPSSSRCWCCLSRGWQVAIGFHRDEPTAGLILAWCFQPRPRREDTAHPPAASDGSMGRRVGGARARHDRQLRQRQPADHVVRGWAEPPDRAPPVPKVCSVHYPALAPIVREITREYGLPYYHQPTLFSAIRSHFRTLQRHARRPLATASAPSPRPGPGRFARRRFF